MFTRDTIQIFNGIDQLKVLTEATSGGAVAVCVPLQSLAHSAPAAKTTAKAAVPGPIPAADAAAAAAAAET